jgi:hypothetical protein
VKFYNDFYQLKMRNLVINSLHLPTGKISRKHEHSSNKIYTL